MPITENLVIETHVAPILRAAGFSVKFYGSEYGGSDVINRRTSIGLHMGRELLINGPDARQVAELLLKECRPFGEELKIQVTQTEPKHECMHELKKTPFWGLFLLRPDMVCTKCGAEIHYNDSC